MNLHKHQLYLLEHHSESSKIGTAFTRINTEGKSMIMKLCPGHSWYNYCLQEMIKSWLVVLVSHCIYIVTHM